MKSIKYISCLLIFVLLFNCKKDTTSLSRPSNYETEINITILYTNDEHGWMEPYENYGGSAGMMGLWKDNEGYVEGGNFLILSGGDMWTGPAISTWFEGESMTDVMNAMHYDAAAVGNHEFDFGLDGIADRAQQANFPFLAANIRLEGTSDFPEYVAPYIIKNINNVKIGIVGLTTLRTPIINFPENVAGLDFISYESALNEIVPQMKSEGAEIIILIGHFGYYNMLSLIQLAKTLGICMIGGGHSHELISEKMDEITLIEAGAYMRNYVRADITYDTLDNSLIEISSEIFINEQGDPDAQIESVVSGWKDQLSEALSEVIGYADETIGMRSNGMYNMITDSWLIALPEADITITNIGGIRQDIYSGDITLATMVGVLPFENYIVELDLTGSELIACLDEYLVVGGMTTIGGYYHSDGTQLVMDSTYQVLTTDYLYYTLGTFNTYDPAPEETSINFRQPVIDWVRSLNTSEADPLNNYLDTTARQ